MFPFKPRKTRWEIARDTVLEAAHDAADNLQSATHSAASLAAHSAQEAALKAGTVAATATIAGKHLLETVEDKLHHSGESAHSFKENFTDSLSRNVHIADERAHDVAQNAAQSARQTAQAAREAAAAKRELLAHKKDDLSQNLHNKADNAREVAAQTAARLRHKTDDVVENAQEARRGWFQRGSEAVNSAQETVQQKAQNAQEFAAQKNDELAETAAQSRKEIRRRAKDAEKQAKKEAALVTASDLEDTTSEDARVEIEEGSSSAMWIVIGLAVGAVVALLLWPKIGGRNRAALQDKFDEVKDTASETVHKVADKAADKVDDLSRRADGLAHEVHAAATAPVGTDNPVPDTTSDDITIADRVRSELGRTPLGQEIFLNIDCVEGVVSVRGDLPDMTTQIEFEAMIRAMPGVREVIFDTPAPDAPPREDSLNHQTEIAERVTDSQLADAVEQPKDQSPADEPFVG